MGIIQGFNQNRQASEKTYQQRNPNHVAEAQGRKEKHGALKLAMVNAGIRYLGLKGLWDKCDVTFDPPQREAACGTNPAVGSLKE